MFKTDILFNGYYGYLNTGDDAFVEVAAWGAAYIWKKSNVRFLIRENKAPNTITPIRAFPLSIPKTYGIQQNLLIKNTNAFILAGGSTLNSIIEHQPAKNMAWNLKKMNPSYKIGAIGVSLGPFKTVEDEISVRNYLKSFDFLSLRDRYSFEYAMSLDLPFKPVEAFDLAALLPSIYKSEDILIQNGKITHKKVIGISICRYESFIKCGNIENEERRNGVLLEIIKKIDRSRKDISFKFFIINGNKVNGDSEITQWFLKNANLENSYEIIPYSPNTRKIYNSIAKCDLVVSVRLHAAIFACFAKIPFVLIEYHRKCADFLQDVGYGESKRFYDLNIELEESVKILNSYLDDRSSFKIPFMLEEQINKSMLNFTSINL